MRGLETFCVACGARRMPLAAMPVNLAGRPSKVGGTIARVLGWAALVGGLSVAAIVGALLQVIFPAGVAGWIVGGVIATLAVGLGVLLLVSGKKLHVAGVDREREVTLQAITALASRSGGVVTARDAGRALGVSEARADALLTDLAKQGDRVRLEVDDSGQLLYFVGPPVRRRIRLASDAPASSPSGPAAEAEEELDEAARRRMTFDERR